MAYNLESSVFAYQWITVSWNNINTQLALKQIKDITEIKKLLNILW